MLRTLLLVCPALGALVRGDPEDREESVRLLPQVLAFQAPLPRPQPAPVDSEPFSPVPAAEESTHGSQLTRRAALAATVAAAAAPVVAGAYDTIPEVSGDFKDMEKARAEFQKELEKNRAEIAPYVKKITATTTAKDFSMAADEFSVWLIGHPQMPQGIAAGPIKEQIADTYNSLPKRSFACEKTRNNNGICFSPGEPADSSYKSVIDYLRKSAGRKGKGGASNADGISAANTLPF